MLLLAVSSMATVRGGWVVRYAVATGGTRGGLWTHGQDALVTVKRCSQSVLLTSILIAIIEIFFCFPTFDGFKCLSFGEINRLKNLFPIGSVHPYLKSGRLFYYIYNDAFLLNSSVSCQSYPAI